MLSKNDVKKHNTVWIEHNSSKQIRKTNYQQQKHNLDPKRKKNTKDVANADLNHQSSVA